MAAADLDTEPTPRKSDNGFRTRAVALAAAASVVVVAVFLVQRIVSTSRPAPYPAAAVNATVHLEVVGPDAAQQAIDRLAGPGRLTAVHAAATDGQPAPQVVVGQLSFRTPPNAPTGGDYVLFLIDRAQDTPVPRLYGVGPVGTTVVQGWDGAYAKVADRYPWLHMLAARRNADGTHTDPGMAMSFPPDTPAPVTFEAVLDRSSLPIIDPGQQLTVALVFIGKGERIYWATKLAG